MTDFASPTAPPTPGTETPSGGRGRKKLRHLAVALLLILLVFAVSLVPLSIWRRGTVVAEAEFNPGIAPFKLTVRRVPVPVTDSQHFIVELTRGQYVVTSFRYFWAGYTPQHVEISWPCIERFTVTFDRSYTATCDWSWGAGATWTMSGPDQHRPGLSPYYFEPRNPPPSGCQPVSLPQ